MAKGMGGIADALAQKMTASEPSEDPADGTDGNATMEEAAQSFMDAIQEGDPSKVADTFKTLFQMCEDEPHEEVGTPAE
jgi:hypothetical protein